jgi:RNA polymerase sigma factor (sigma-70 family)
MLEACSPTSARVSKPLASTDATNGIAAAERLVIDHLDLVDIATRHVGSLCNSPAIDQDDLIGEGRVALIKAARRYEPHKGSFRSYAFGRIRGAMIDALRRDHLLSRYARDRGARVAVVSIDRPIGQGNLTLSDTLVDVRASVEEIVAHREQLASALADPPARSPARMRLTPSELEVLRGAAAGETAIETASRLQKSIDTVKSQRQAALRRLGARSVAHAVFMAHDEIAA